MTAPTYAQILKREEQHTRRRAGSKHPRPHPLTTVMLMPLGPGWSLNSCYGADGMDDLREERGDAV